VSAGAMVALLAEQGLAWAGNLISISLRLVLTDTK
jgi:hypothetical protein